jgi:UDP-N-acetylglucosamine acyltransferase
MKAHATSIVDPAAVVADDVEIGPFCVVGPKVRIGAGCRLVGRVILTGPIAAGCRNVFHPNVAIGGAPQTSEPVATDGRIEIGDDNVFREGASVHLPSAPGGITRIGSRNTFYPCSTVGHDCSIGDDIVVGPFAGLGGHTVVQNRARIDGSGGTNERVTIGEGSRLESHLTAEADVPSVRSTP